MQYELSYSSGPSQPPPRRDDGAGEPDVSAPLNYSWSSALTDFPTYQLRQTIDQNQTRETGTIPKRTLGLNRSDEMEDTQSKKTRGGPR